MGKKSTPLSDILDTYKDDRKCPRLIMGCPMSLSLPGGHKAQATLYDISLTGLQAWIGIKEADDITIQPDKTSLKNVSNLEVIIRITVNGQDQEINLQAKPLHVKKILEDYLVIGMEITNRDKKHVAILEKFIEMSMEKS
jgi:hypothetical protein